MSQTTQRAFGRLVGPALMAAAMFAILISLGVWQLHRLAWKRDILAAIAQADSAPAIPLPDHPTRFQKVAVSGTLRPDLSILYGADVRDTPQGPMLGAQLIQPLIRPGAPPLLVDRGWIPDRPDPANAAPPGPITLQGYLRDPDHPHLFSPRDDPGKRRFYTLNPAAMAAALHLPQVAPFTLVALGPATDAVPIPATALPRPPNDHLNYAITWFGLAAALAAVFLIWAVGRSRPPTSI